MIVRKSLVVHHFGPDPATVGGMASVIRVLSEHCVGGDVVTVHPTWSPHSQLDTARLLASATRSLIMIPPSDVAHLHLSEGGSFLREGALLTRARRQGITTVATIHGAAFVPFAEGHPRLVSAVLKRSDLVTCLERQALEIVRRYAPQVRAELVPNPAVVEDNIAPVDRTEEFVVFAGEISLRKGADVLQQAWHRVAERRPTARCLMVGPAGDFTPTRTERLEWRAPANALEMRAILQRARVVALPTRAEGMPMILTEAMSSGRPFVSTPVGAIPELASAGGMLVAVNDANALADRLVDLLANPALARAIGESGRQFCLATRSIGVIDTRLRELYLSSASC